MVFVFSRSSLALKRGMSFTFFVLVSKRRRHTTAFNFTFDTAFDSRPPPPHSSVSPTWSSVAHPCSSGDRRAAAGRAAPASPRQKHSAAPAAAHSSPPDPQTQARPGGGETRLGHQNRYVHWSTALEKHCDVLLTHLTATVTTYDRFVLIYI